MSLLFVRLNVIQLRIILPCWTRHDTISPPIERSCWINNPCLAGLHCDLPEFVFAVGTGTRFAIFVDHEKDRAPTPFCGSEREWRFAQCADTDLLLDQLVR